MSQQRDTKYLTETAANAIGQYLRVKTPGACVVATATDPCIGVTQDPVLAAGPCTIGTKGVGTLKMTASEPITAGNPVYGAAAGKIAATGTIVEGTALESAGADGDIIEVLPTPNTDISSAIAGTTNASFTVDSDSSGAKIKLDTAGATGNFTATIAAANISGNITLTLPAATGTFATVAGAETLTNKTLTSPVIGATPRFGHTVTPVAAAGSTIADAAALADTYITHITSDGAGKGVKLPAVTAAGVMRFVINNSSTAAELYAESTGTVNGLSADASVVIPASKGLICISTAAKTWIAFDLTAVATTS
jgi:hypothetical protein